MTIRTCGRGCVPGGSRRGSPAAASKAARGSASHRWVVERSFAWLHAFKRLRTRYERGADIHLGLLQLACAVICYRQLAVVLK